MEPVLNMNNEVVRLRKVVKNVKVLTIRKIGRIIAKLRKGTEEAIAANQGRIKAFIEEIETIKKMKPDDVVKTALEDDFRFDEAFNQENSITEMEIVARLASNPLMKEKISAMRDSVKAFKEARKNPQEEVGEKEKTCMAPTLAKSVSIRVADKSRQQKAAQEKFKQPVKGAITKTRESCSKTKVVKQTCEKKTVENKSEKKAPAAHSDSSDIEDSDKEDKEYFDDSTEERFLKHPSDFDTDSDSDDDFFIGKVRQTRKKKSNNPDKKVKKDKSQPESLNSTTVRTEEQNWKPATKKLESVFCQTLSSAPKNSHPRSSNMNRDGKLPPFRNKYGAPHAKTFTRNPFPARGGAAKQPIKRQHEESLHPSWEASKKRKEQSQIAVFQGKKITFNE